MILTLEEVLQRVDHTEAEMAEYRRAANEWERLWRGDVFAEPAPLVQRREGVEQITLPTLYNAIDLGLGLFSETPKVEAFSNSVEHDDDEAADLRSAWLTAFYQQLARQQRMNLVDALAAQSLVLGRHAFDVKWIGDLIPKALEGRVLPIHVRILDPRNVGMHQGPFFVDWAYHIYREQPEFIRAYYGERLDVDAILAEKRAIYPPGAYVDLEVIDFWYRAPLGTKHEGKIYNCVIVERRFAKPPAATDYADIPIIVGYADSYPFADEVVKGISLVDPLAELYVYQCRMFSQLATWFRWHSAPTITMQNERGLNPGDLPTKPGQIKVLPWGTKVDQIQVQANLPLAEHLMRQVEGLFQQTAFPAAQYGQAPGSVTAGFAIDTLARQGTRRVRRSRHNLELSFGIANALILSLVETHAAKDKRYKKGVVVGGVDDRQGGSLYRLKLTKRDVQGAWDTQVSLEPTDELTDNAKVAVLIQLLDKGVISQQTLRSLIKVRLPKDEDLRVWAERAMQDQELVKKVFLRAMQARWPKTWPQMIQGLPGFEQLAQLETGAPVAPATPPLPAGSGAVDPLLQGPGGAPLLPGMPGQLPPEVAQGLAGIGPDGGPPPPSGAAGPLQPAGAPLQGVPPEMMGQLIPQQLGIPPGPDQAALFSQQMGQPMSEEELLARLIAGGM